ncbi:DUF2510 domain-containing protein [Actinosynnema sp. NPDC047251]|uniref:DUF2510 domain-containing protein n=1 Tax=Saccharothrix espanaensis (strain ATCC 51144 / DSM 44229 / JCM 9112 / NBRC 15066 / NRRL 15764) TaxID=1179773 RepID=K0K3J2_SACES|nr:DUF2510 domain-containing protein [Saccharothrix espanaensis]CCH34830.1 hypothetical protein BN6_76050 [Saccharothrix espanaensis DSM 44229]
MTQSPVRPPAWLPDPLDDSLVRYWDGGRWTFHTAVRRVAVAEPVAAAPPEPAVLALRPDIAAALDRVRGALTGSMKEVHLLAGHLRPEERVLALTAAQGEGFGVLACTDRRLLFLFVGVLRRQFVEVDWNQAKGVFYDRASKAFTVYTTKPTKRAVPAMSVRVGRVEDAQAVAHAAQAASAAPRLDIV